MSKQKETAERLGALSGQGKAKGISTSNCTSSKYSSLAGAEPIVAICPLTPECGTKKERVLNHLTHYGSTNRFEASRLLYDSTLNSTISFLSNAHGINFDKQWESVLNRAGGSTKVKRYSLADESRGAALKLLKHWRAR